MQPASVKATISAVAEWAINFIQDAKEAIEKDPRGLTVFIIPPGSAVTRDYRTDRVRIYSDGIGKVQGAPGLG